MTRRRLNASQREELWQAEAAKARAIGRGPNPICNICTFDVLPGSEWHESHDPLKPRWLGGEITGIAHAKCNRRHNHQHDTPLYAKSERQRKRFMDFKVAQQPLPGGRDDRLKKKMNGRVVERNRIPTA